MKWRSCRWTCKRPLSPAAKVQLLSLVLFFLFACLCVRLPLPCCSRRCLFLWIVLATSSTISSSSNTAAYIFLAAHAASDIATAWITVSNCNVGGRSLNGAILSPITAALAASEANHSAQIHISPWSCNDTLLWDGKYGHASCPKPFKLVMLISAWCLSRRWHVLKMVWNSLHPSYTVYILPISHPLSYFFAVYSVNHCLALLGWRFASYNPVPNWVPLPAVHRNTIFTRV